MTHSCVSTTERVAPHKTGAHQRVLNENADGADKDLLLLELNGSLKLRRPWPKLLFSFL